MKEKVVIVVTRSKKPDITGFIQVRYPNPGKTAVHLHLLPFSTIKTQENSQQKSTKETALLMWHTKNGTVRSNSNGNKVPAITETK